MGLKEKIEFEYKRFYLDCMRTSRDYIFAHSAEIEAKKILKDALLALEQKVDRQTMQFLVVQESVLDAAYRFWTDEKQKEGATDKEEMERLLMRWIVQLQS